jgi:predicted Zn-dependent peptidase
MYDDEPDWQLYHGFISNLYENTPVNVDIAGDVDSIYKIDKETLYRCYNTFYHPANMLLFVVGNFDVDVISNLILDNQSKKEFPVMEQVQRALINEPTVPVTDYNEREMDLAIPKCLVGYKLKLDDIVKEEQQKRELALKIVLDILFSKSGDVYKHLVDEHLINDTFGFEYSEESNYGFAVIGGDTPEPARFIEEFKKQMKHLKIKESDFIRTKKRKLGAFLSALNSLEYIANQFTRYKFNGMDLFETTTILQELTFDEFKEIIHDFFDENQFTAYVLNPKK